MSDHVPEPPVTPDVPYQSLAPRLRPGVSVSKNDAGIAQIKIPRANTLLRRFLSCIFTLSSYNILTLDETGTEILDLVDGQRAFRDLVGHLQEVRSMKTRDADYSMALFMDMLVREGVIELAPPEE